MCGKGRPYLNVSQLWDGRVGSDPPFLSPPSLILSSPPPLLLLPFLSSCFVSWGNKKHFVATQLNSFAIRALTDSGFAFLCFYFLFLSSSLRSVVMQSLISPVWRRSFPSWTCWERRRAIQGETLSCTVPVNPADSDPLRDYPHPRTGEAKWAHSALLHSYPMYQLKFVKRRKCFGII